MMSDKQNGGPAFPGKRMESIRLGHGADNDRWESREVNEGGMSLRDYFAGQALASGCSPSECYPAADALLKYR
jgi:hypothetical protein